MLKSFKDANGTKVIKGELVSILDVEEYTGIYKVASISRRRRKVEVCLFDNVTQTYMYANSKQLVSEM